MNIGTKVYRRKDGAIVLEGEISEVIGPFDDGTGEVGTVIVFSDETILEWEEKTGPGAWKVRLRRHGDKWLNLHIFGWDGGSPITDIVTFAEGLSWAKVATGWVEMRAHGCRTHDDKEG